MLEIDSAKARPVRANSRVCTLMLASAQYLHTTTRNSAAIAIGPQGKLTQNTYLVLPRAGPVHTTVGRRLCAKGFRLDITAWRDIPLEKRGLGRLSTSWPKNTVCASYAWVALIQPYIFRANIERSVTSAKEGTSRSYTTDNSSQKDCSVAVAFTFDKDPEAARMMRTSPLLHDCR